MYLKNIHIENVGPIDEVKIDFPINQEGNPLPVIIVGENGSGKSIFLSFIVNALISFRQQIYENIEVEKGKVYKLRSPLYIKTNKDYYFAELNFEENLEYKEWVLPVTKKEFEDKKKYSPNIKDWKNIESSNNDRFYISNLTSNELGHRLIEKRVCIYLPPNRFEEPAWLNETNLKSKANFQNLLRFKSLTNRTIIIHFGFHKIKDWLLDVILDSIVFEQKVQKFLTKDAFNNQQILNIVVKEPGQNTYILSTINAVLCAIFGENTELKINPKQHRFISIYKAEKLIIPSLFSLSSGESLLLLMCLTIIRDASLSEINFITTTDIGGIAIIDEIDLHLHSIMLRDTLPQLIKLFPKIQFIITTHSPLFLIGMDQHYGNNKYKIVEMPSGNTISSERFKEFETAFTFFKETSKYNEEIIATIEKNNQKPILFVEGNTDKILVETAWKKLRTGECPFRIENGYSKSHLRVILLDNDFINKAKNNIIIGMFDFDEAFSDWEGLKKQYDSHIADETKGLTKKHKEFKFYAFLLPVPTFRKTLASSNYGTKSCLNIELLFEDNILKTNDNIEEKALPGGGKIVTFKGNKDTFAKKASTLKKEDFIHFENILQLIENLITS